MYLIDKNKKPTSFKKYPFLEMKVGDSFLVECEENMKLKTRQRIGASARSICQHYELDWKFSIRAEESGIRAFRIK